MPGEWQRETVLIPPKWRRAGQKIRYQRLRIAVSTVGQAWVAEVKRATSIPRWTYRELRRNPLFARSRPSGIDPALVGGHRETNFELSRGWGGTAKVYGAVAWLYILNQVRYAKYFNSKRTKRMVGRPVTKKAWADLLPLREAALRAIGKPLGEK